MNFNTVMGFMEACRGNSPKGYYMYIEWAQQDSTKTLKHLRSFGIPDKSLIEPSLAGVLNKEDEGP